MVTFGFTIRNHEGLSTESAGRLVREAIGCTGRVTIRKGGKSGDAKLIFHVLTLSIKAGQEVEITVEGEREREEAAALEKYIKENIV